MKRTLSTVAAFAGFLVTCAIFAAVALGFLGFFD